MSTSSVRVISKPGAALPLSARGTRVPNGESFNLLLLAFLTLATTAVAFYDLYLLFTNIQ